MKQEGWYLGKYMERIGRQVGETSHIKYEIIITRTFGTRGVEDSLTILKDGELASDAEIKELIDRLNVYIS